MAQSIGLGNRLQLFHVKVTEWTTAGCEQNLLNRIVVLTHQTLENGGVLTVHRQDRRMVLLSQL